jgi:dTDP-4-amino-4,6-dideoxygalactose transaminase
MPVFVDSEPDTFNLDPKRLADAVDGLDPALRAVGVIPVDLFGLPADYPRLHEVAEANGMWVVADAAQSFGGALGGTDVGRLAPITTTSFFPAKPLGCYGDGGAVFCEDRETAAVLRSLRVHGSGGHKYDNSRIGINGRLDTIQAAILIEKLALFPSELTARQRVADVYRAALSDVARVPEIAPDFRSTWAQYTLRVEAGTRDRLADELGERGVPHAVYYPLPLHLQTAYRGYPRGSGGLPVAEQLAEEVLSLPMHPYLSMGDQEKVIHAVRAALAR